MRHRGRRKAAARTIGVLLKGVGIVVTILGLLTFALANMDVDPGSSMFWGVVMTCLTPDTARWTPPYEERNQIRVRRLQEYQPNDYVGIPCAFPLLQDFAQKCRERLHVCQSAGTSGAKRPP